MEIEFIDSTEVNDYISKKCNIINPELNEHINLIGTLNNAINQFTFYNYNNY